MDGDLYEALDRIDGAMAEGDWEAAERLVDEAREAFGDDPELFVSEVELALERGDWAECIERADAYADRVSGPIRGEILALQGYALFYADRDQEARETFNEAVGADPELWMAIVGRATVHEHLEFPRAAKLDADRAIEIDDQEAEPFAIRGAAHLQLGNLSGAERDFETAVEIDPLDGESRLSLGRIRALDDRATAARETLEPLVEEGGDPDYRLPAAILRSQMAVSLGSEQQALEDAELAREIAPDAPWGWLQEAAAHLSGSEPGEAIAALKEAEARIDEPRAFPDLFELRASAYRRLDKPEKADENSARIDGPARLPELVYGPELNPTSGSEEPEGPVDVESVLTQLFGDPSAAPPGYADQVRELIDDIPEIAEEHPEASELEIELPPIQEGGESPGEIVVQLEHPGRP